MTRKARKAQPKGERSGRNAGTTTPDTPVRLPRPEPGSPFAEALAKLTPQRQQFVLHYVTFNNGLRAALHAKYAKSSARGQASYLLTIPNVKDAVKAGYDVMLAPPGEVLNRTVEVMRSTLEDFYSFEDVLVRPECWRPLRELRQEKLDQIAFEDEYARRAELDGEEFTEHLARQAGRRREVLRMDMELERDPNARRWARGEPIVRREPRLDLAKAEALGVLHLAKSTKPTKWGLAVELEDRQHARDQLGKYHGLWGVDEGSTDAPPGLPDGTGLEDASNDQLAGELARLLGEDAL